MFDSANIEHALMNPKYNKKSVDYLTNTEALI